MLASYELGLMYEKTGDAKRQANTYAPLRRNR
jgi:hypothetical protein